jgi:hypothetical protein
VSEESSVWKGQRQGLVERKHSKRLIEGRGNDEETVSLIIQAVFWEQMQCYCSAVRPVLLLWEQF